MGRTRVSFAVIFVFLLLLASEEGIIIIMGKETEAIWRHPCKTPSKRFKGPCVSNRNCINVCKSEGHDYGECEGIRRRCLCSLHC